MRVPSLCGPRSDGRYYATDPATRKPVYFGTDFARAGQLYSGWAQRFLSRAQRVGPRLARVDPVGLTVAELCEAFLGHARSWYRKNGRETKEVHNFKRAFSFLAPYALESVAEFDVAALEAVQRAMIDHGWNRKHVNDQVGRVRRLFRWGVRAAGVSGGQVVELGSLPPLQAGRTDAAEGEPIPPVSWETVKATLPYFNQRDRLLVLLHWWSGMRAEELVSLQKRDIITTKTAWTYAVPVEANKCAHHGKQKTVYFGPRARSVLRVLLRACLHDDSFLFRSRGRGSPGHLTVNGYRQSVEAAAQRAGVPHWFPLQLRHAAAQRVGEKDGVEAVAAMLGHERLETTQVYYANKQKLARATAERRG